MNWLWLLPVGFLLILSHILALMLGGWLYERDLLAEMKRTRKPSSALSARRSKKPKRAATPPENPQEAK